MAADDDDRTEEPTPRKLEQAREKGDIIYSPEVGAALSLIAVTALIAWMSGPILSDMARALVGFLAMPDQYSSDPQALRAIGAAVGLRVLGIFALAALALRGAGVAARYVQDRPTFTGE